MKHHTMKTNKRLHVQLHTFLISTLHGGDWLASHSSHFIPPFPLLYPLDRRLGRPLSKPKHDGKEKNPCLESMLGCPIKKYYGGVISSGMKFIPNFIKICHSSKVIGRGRQTHRHDNINLYFLIKLGK
jgi:hypothetical protein